MNFPYFNTKYFLFCYIFSPVPWNILRAVVRGRESLWTNQRNIYLALDQSIGTTSMTVCFITVEFFTGAFYFNFKRLTYYFGFLAWPSIDTTSLTVCFFTVEFFTAAFLFKFKFQTTDLLFWISGQTKYWHYLNDCLPFLYWNFSLVLFTVFKFQLHLTELFFGCFLNCRNLARHQDCP
jgi:hypothetical protein